MKMILLRMKMYVRMKLDKNREIWITLIKQNRAEEPYSQKYYNSSRFPIIGNHQRNMIL